MCLGIFLNLSLLLGIKYSLPNIVTYVPIGVSFFTLQGISLILDSFRGDPAIKVNSLSNYFLRTSLFISYFPVITAGPIIKSKEYFAQISPKYFKNLDWEKITKQIILGFFLKIVVADGLQNYSEMLTYPKFLEISSVDLTLLIFGYTIQLFSDFAGYSLIAMGISLTFGYKLFDNFNFPFISRSFTDFWHRWHISLSSFFRDYVFLSLGGNRLGPLRLCLNIFIVMILSWIWHGSIAGVGVFLFIQGLLLIVEKLFKFQKDNSNRYTVLTFRIGLIYIISSYLLVLIKYENIDHIKFLLSAYLSNFSVVSSVIVDRRIFYYVIFVALLHINYLLKEASSYYRTLDRRFGWIAYAIMLFFVIINIGTPSKSVIYSKF